MQSAFVPAREIGLSKQQPPEGWLNCETLTRGRAGLVPSKEKFPASPKERSYRMNAFFPSNLTTTGRATSILAALALLWPAGVIVRGADSPEAVARTRQQID